MNAVTAAKRSISFDPDVLAAAESLAKAHHGRNLSALVNDAVAAAVERDEQLRDLGALLNDMDAEFGAIPDEAIADAQREIEEWDEELRSMRAR